MACWGSFPSYKMCIRDRYQVFPRPPGEEKPPEEKKPKPPQEEKPKKPQKEKPSAGELFALGKELLEGLWPPVRWRCV